MIVCLYSLVLTLPVFFLVFYLERVCVGTLVRVLKFELYRIKLLSSLVYTPWYNYFRTLNV